MNDIFCPNGKWDWKGFEIMVGDMKNDKDRAHLAQASFAFAMRTASSELEQTRGNPTASTEALRWHRGA